LSKGSPPLPHLRTGKNTPIRHSSRDIRDRADEILQQAEQNGEEEKAEQQLRNHIFLGVGRAVEQYVKLRGNTTTIEAYFEEWIFGDYWKKHPRCLTEETRNILLSGAYVWDEYKQTMLNDWAAPAIQYCRALETKINYYPDSKHHYPDINKKGFNVPSGNMTLGAVETIYKLKNKDVESERDANKVRSIQTAKHNWDLCCTLVNRSGGDIPIFEAMLKQMMDEHVSYNRNEIAYGRPILQNMGQELRDAIMGHRNKPGILYRLVECLEPKR
jgi:hypothetical protein